MKRKRLYRELLYLEINTDNYFNNDNIKYFCPIYKNNDKVLF